MISCRDSNVLTHQSADAFHTFRCQLAFDLMASHARALFYLQGRFHFLTRLQWIRPI